MLHATTLLPEPAQPAQRSAGAVLIAGARPNFVKTAALHKAIGGQIVYLRQQETPALTTALGAGLPWPAPAHTLPWQDDPEPLADLLLTLQPGIVVVVGDTYAALQGARAAAMAGIPVAHVEAGLRSFDDSMPEERNRIAIDRLSEILLATEQAAVDNLLREGYPPERIHLVGNVMIDALRQAPDGPPPFPETRILLTFHRPSNVDSGGGLDRILDIARQLPAPACWPMHPRTLDRLEALGRLDQLRNVPNLKLTPPLAYADFIRQLRHSQLIVTDSGGLQEETTALGIPCITFRPNTERPVTVSLGTNVLVPDLDPARVARLARQALQGKWEKGSLPPLWDGHAAGRIAAVLGDVECRTPNIEHRISK
jgi:UDP-N-acetylglucosamine 2-epimerase (non-hydrolysing)